MMDYKTMYPWAPSPLLEETSEFTTCEKIVLYRKSEHPKKKCLFGREDDKFVKVVPCMVDELVCCDEASDPDGPFCFFYSIVLKKLLLRLPVYSFKRAFLTEINTAPAQLHPNSWAFVRGFSILCHRFGHLPLVEVFLYFFKPRDQVASCG